MKKILIILLILTSANITHAQEPITEIIKAGIKKIVVAVDLKIQRLQNETIKLQNAQKVVENLMSKTGLANISTWMEKQKELYREHYENLKKIRNTVATYHKVKEIIAKQVAIVNIYKQSIAAAKKDPQLTSQEITTMLRTYSNILDQSVENLDQLFLVMNTGLQMDDAGRMALINQVAQKIDDNYRDLQSYKNENIWITNQRTNNEKQIRYMQNLHGLSR